MSKEQLRFETWTADGVTPGVRVGGSDNKERAIELCKETAKAHAWTLRNEYERFHTVSSATHYKVIDTKTDCTLYDTVRDEQLQDVLNAIVYGGTLANAMRYGSY